MTPNTKSFLTGAAIATGIEVGGAVVGALSNPACTTSNAFLCGPEVGGVLGGVYAGGLSMFIGADLAVFSPQKRVVGFGMLATPLALGIVGALFRAPKTSTLPAASVTVAAPALTSVTTAVQPTPIATTPAGSP